MKLQQESIADLWPEVMPLLREHFDEISANKDIPLNPKVDLYNQMEEAGAFVVFTAREDDGALLGYAAYFVSYNMHYQDSFQAVQDVLFLTKPARKGMAGIRLIKYADEQLADLGCELVYHHVKVFHDFGLILERIGYNQVEKIYSKRLG